MICNTNVAHVPGPITDPAAEAPRMTAKAHTAGASSSTDRIEKRVVLRASRARVWRAITDAQEFGAWFRGNLEGTFAKGATIRAGSPIRATSTPRWRGLSTRPTHTGHSTTAAYPNGAPA